MVPITGLGAAVLCKNETQRVGQEPQQGDSRHVVKLDQRKGRLKEGQQ